MIGEMGSAIRLLRPDFPWRDPSWIRVARSEATAQAMDEGLMEARSGVSIRRYRDTDLDAVIAVFQRAVREIAVRDYDAAQIAAWSTVDRARWRERRLSRPTWVAIRDGAVVGFSDLEPDGHLDMMFVHPGFQGAGIASRLLATVEAAARDGGLTDLFTEASLTAWPFFERRGFQRVAEQQVELRGAILANVRMRKSLGP